MLKKTIILTLMLSMVFGISAQTKTKGRNTSKQKVSAVLSIERKVLGKHMLALQWISWEDFGTCTITKDSNGVLHCKGEQRSKENNDYLKIDGTIAIVNSNHLVLKGTIDILVNYLNNGKVYKRNGSFNFKARGNRRYWRLQEMERNNDDCVDYVDIFFR